MMCPPFYLIACAQVKLLSRASDDHNLLDRTCHLFINLPFPLLRHERAQPCRKMSEDANDDRGWLPI